MRYENIINDVSTKMIETRDEFIFQTISSWIVDNYQITVSKETLSKAVNAKILHDEYMRGYRKGYQEGRDVILESFDDKVEELKTEIAEEKKQ